MKREKKPSRALPHQARHSHLQDIKTKYNLLYKTWYIHGQPDSKWVEGIAEFCYKQKFEELCQTSSNLQITDSYFIT